ncbi:hypothetical protein L204_105955 [Cryptococcus depauperatus]|nr:hypothetical protein L204_05077 [Cryptococcus depauperatus CBS 7855]
MPNPRDSRGKSKRTNDSSRRSTVSASTASLPPLAPKASRDGDIFTSGVSRGLSQAERKLARKKAREMDNHKNTRREESTLQDEVIGLEMIWRSRYQQLYGLTKNSQTEMVTHLKSLPKGLEEKVATLTEQINGLESEIYARHPGTQPSTAFASSSTAPSYLQAHPYGSSQVQSYTQEGYYSYPPGTASGSWRG